MTINDSKKVDTLWKKVVYGVTQTNYGGKDAPNESVASPLPVYASQIWTQDSAIPIPAPAATGGVVVVYGGATAVKCVADPTVGGNRTWLALTSPTADPTVAANRLGDWIPPAFDPSYLVKVYAGNPASGGVQLNALVDNQEWVFDYQSGVLNFINTVPSAAGNGIWLVGSRYTGTKGVAGGGNGGGGSLSIYDEGQLVGTATELNFVGTDVLAATATKPGRINIYVPTPPVKSHWNTADGSNGDQTVVTNFARFPAYISAPTTEGSPYFTAGWAGSVQSATNVHTQVYTTPAATTGFGGDSTMTVEVFSRNAAGELVQVRSYTTPPITGNATGNAVYGFGTPITVDITGYDQDVIRYAAKATVTVKIRQILSDNGQSSGRFVVKITHKTDTATDGSGPHVFTLPETFYDSILLRPTINGAFSIDETGGKVVTKHLSGIEYYTLGSQFTVAVQDIGGHNRDTQRTEASLLITAPEYGFTDLGQSPFGTGADRFTGWTNVYNAEDIDYQKTDWAIDVPNFRFIGPSGSASAVARDPWGDGNVVAAPDKAILVDTYPTIGTPGLLETFDAEDQRLYSDFATVWDSTASLVAGDALVMGGKLMVPSASFYIRSDGTNDANANWTAYKPNIGGPNPNYTSLGAPASFRRKFYDGTATTRASFTMVFAGVFKNGNAMADLSTGDLQVFVRKAGGLGNTGPTAPALALHGPSFNAAVFDDGVTNSYIREASSSGNTVNATFGAWPMQMGILVEVRLNSPQIILDSISVTFY